MGSGDGIGVALDALRSDARKWRTAAEDLAKPRNALDSLHVSVADVSIFAVWAGLDKTFNEAATAMNDVLEQASAYFNKLSSDLDEAAKEYQDDDQKGMHEIKGGYRMQGDLNGG